MNSIALTGRLVRDPETRSGANGTISRITLAVKRPGAKDITDFIPCVAFEKTAEILSRYTKKGSFIGIQGKMVSGSYQNKDGQTVYTIELYADRITFEGGGKKAVAESADKKNVNGGDYTPPGFETLEEDIPF